MKNIQLLDCTLRDGGFVNNWEFGYFTIRDIVSRLDKARINIIELGYLRDWENYDKNRTVLSHTKDVEILLKNISLKNAKVVAIIDYGSCGIDRIMPCEQSLLNGIRVTFKKNEIDEALTFCAQLKEKGYAVFTQPVSITSYSDMEILELINKVNELNPYALAIVDTYGLMLKKQLIYYYYMFDHNLNADIQIGYHPHNNFQLAFSNCLELLSIAGTSRNIILDTTLFGIGKSAGNAQTELIADFLNSEYGTIYDINHILEAIDLHISPIYMRTPWGYRIEYFISASHKCHPQYVSHLIEKCTLSVQSINEIISMLDAPKSLSGTAQDKLTYNEDLVEQLYLQYQMNRINDDEACRRLQNLIGQRNILILAPGSSLITYKEKILRFIEEYKPIIISINFIPTDYNIDCLFVSNAKRYSKILDLYNNSAKKPLVMASSNISESSTPLDYVFNYNNLLLDDTEIQDNSTLMFFKLLKNIGFNKVSIAGLDGFFDGSSKSNYVEKDMRLSIKEEKIRVQNQHIKAYVQSLKNIMELDFLTPSSYI